ncbi:hypothetical protein [Saccharomonospora saliphila]|uniref:hypothetical protein n=1 Tax=Saccharomonospora saliphila TaxID=369829 RepID=UPI00036AAB76|nr:hypothetical protein [Saccharomonospora saliphila]
MTENHDLAPEADVEEQEQAVAGGEEVPASVGVPLDANPADVAEQSAPVPVDEDDEALSD